MIDAEIVTPVNNNRDDSNDEIPLQSSVSHSQAHDSFEVVLKWLESQGDTDSTQLLLGKKWGDKAALQRVKAKSSQKLLIFLVQYEMFKVKMDTM